MSGSAARGTSGGDFDSHEIDSGRKNMGYFRSARLAAKHEHGGGHYDRTHHTNVPAPLGRVPQYHSNPTAPGAAGHGRTGLQGEVSVGKVRAGVHDSDKAKAAFKKY